MTGPPVVDEEVEVVEDVEVVAAEPLEAALGPVDVVGAPPAAADEEDAEGAPPFEVPVAVESAPLPHAASETPSVAKSVVCFTVTVVARRRRSRSYARCADARSQRDHASSASYACAS